MRIPYLFLFAGVLAVPSYAVRLTYDITGPGGQLTPNSSIVQNYGDRVTAASTADGALTYSYGTEGGFTPNVTVSYGPASVTTDNTQTNCPFNLTDTCVYLWPTDFGGLQNVIAQAADQTNGQYGRLVLTLTADAGFDVSLSSFELGGWQNTDLPVGSVTVRNTLTNTVLFSSNNLVAAGTGSTLVSFGTALTGRELAIILDSSNLSGGNGQNVGLDNVVFGQQAVPEPSTMILLGGALTVLGWRRRTAKR